jgi:hypothetical protein
MRSQSRQLLGDVDLLAVERAVGDDLVHVFFTGGDRRISVAA